MAQVEEDEDREERIAMEAVVDAYDEVERALGWYCYLEGKMQFPFRARCRAQRPTSPLEIGDEVSVTGMPGAAERENEMLVSIGWRERSLAVPLSQMEPLQVDDASREAIEDWHYWVGRGYEF